MKHSRSITQFGVLSAAVLSLAMLGDSPWKSDSNGIHYKMANVGIGTNSGSNAQLSVQGDRAIFAQTESRTGRGVFGFASARRGNNYGVYGQSRSNRGRGVFGIASANSGDTYGVHGRSNSTNGYGVFGEGTATTGFPIGGRFEAASTKGTGVFGIATFNSGPNFGVYGKSNSTGGFDFYAAGAGMDYGTNSSRRWKNNIENIADPLKKIAQLRGVYFDWDEEHGGHHDVGFIAEEVGDVLPEIVQYEENGIDAIGMDYSKMTPLLVESVNALRLEQDSQLAKRDEVIQELQDRLAQLELLVAQLVTEWP